MKMIILQLSIYDEPEPKVVIIESPTKLEEQVYIAQKYANETLEEGKVSLETKLVYANDGN